jgi:hypothetical protein
MSVHYVDLLLNLYANQVDDFFIKEMNKTIIKVIVN